MPLAQSLRRALAGASSIVPAAVVATLLALTPAPAPAERASLPAEIPSVDPAAPGAWRRLDADVAWGEPLAVIRGDGQGLRVVPDGLDAIWILDVDNPTEWYKRPVKSPSFNGRDGQPLLFDGVHDRWFWVRLGADYPLLAPEVWLLQEHLTPPEWGTLSTRPGPSARHYALSTFDEGESRILIFGGVTSPKQPFDPFGVDPARVLTDLWEFDVDDLGHWMPITTSGTAPRVLPGGAALWDEAGNRMLVIGHDASNPNEYPPVRIWALSFDGTPTWSVIVDVWNTDLVMENVGAAFFLDSARNRIIVHGGRIAHPHGMYVSDGLSAIDLATGFGTYLGYGPGALPGGRWGHALAYDATHDRLLMPGGSRATDGTSDSRETWAFDLAAATWSRLGPWEGGPGRRGGEATAFDPVAERVLVFGGGSDFPCLYQGCTTNLRSDSWTFDLTSGGARDWDFHARPNFGVEGRIGASFVLDAARSRYVGFGGMGGYFPPFQLYNEVLTAPLAAPSQITVVTTPPDGPAPRHRHAAVVDAKRERMLVLDGAGGSVFDASAVPLRDAWSYDLAGSGGWTRLPLDPAQPTPGPGLQAVVVPGEDRVLAVSWPGPTLALRMWELRLSNPTAWTEIPVNPSERPIGPGRLAWDPVRGRLLLFEFVPAGPGVAATVHPWWLVPGTEQTRWRNVWPEHAADVPDLATSHVVYDAIHDRFVMAHPGEPGSVWALEFGDPKWPIRLSWAANGNGPNGGSEGPTKKIVLHSGSPIDSPIAPRAIDLSRIDPSTWTWSGVEPRLDPQGRPRLQVSDVDGDGHDDWIVEVKRPGGPPRNQPPVVFSAVDLDGVRIEGTLGTSSTVPLELHNPIGEIAAEADVFEVRALAAGAGGAPRLSFATSSDLPVTATLYDVRGRRIAERAWTPSDGAATSAPVTFDGAGRLAPGVYLARVRQGSRDATVRLVTF